MQEETQAVRFGLRAKLFLLVLISFGLLMVLIVWRIGVEADQVANKAIEQALHRSSIIIATDQKNHYQTIHETATGLARDGRILPRVFEEDSATLQDLTGEFKQALNFNILMLTNPEGTIIARSDKASAIGRSVQGRSQLFDTALSGQNAQGIMVSKGQLLQIVAVPIFDNVMSDVVRGSLALAYQFSAQRAKDINQLTDSEIGFFVLKKDKENTLTQPENTFFTNTSLTKPVTEFLTNNPELWQSLLSNDGQPIKLDLSLGEEIFHSILYPLNRKGGGTLGFVMALKSRTQLLQPFKVIQQQVLIAGGACLFFASLFAWAIAQRITRPIIALVPVAHSIQNGDYPEPDAKLYNKRDEVGLLYQAVIKMGKGLKDKAELENYLAQVSEDLSSDEQQSEIEQLVAIDAHTNSVNSSQDKTLLVDENGVNAAIVAEESEVTGNDLLAPGNRFADRYIILRPLGKGTMGSVQLVNDTDLNEQVALKTLFNRDLEGEELNQFKEEIRLARRITHRNILRTFDFGIWKNNYYITMEYIHGFDLSNLIEQQGRLSPKIAIIMGRQICSAIMAAHGEGIIHRDLKPNNIIINKQGVLKIMDFGLAIRFDVSPSDTEDKDQLQSNNTSIAGTPRYMAPEQFTGENIDVATDIYAIGGILHFILSGAPPFKGQNFREMSEQHRFNRPPHLSELHADIPQTLDAIVYKALEKNKQARFKTVSALNDALQKVV